MLTEEQVLALAPDESSKKSGRDLAAPSKWVSRGANESAIWGECQGSGSKPYQTQVDRNNIAFKCSCPSRKFPCKHGIGLLLQYARDAASFKQQPSPAWVDEWISKRQEKEEKKTEQVTKPVDEAAKAKRQKAREQNIQDGIEELLLWMKDIVRSGIITVPEKGSAPFENMSRRMVDAQAPGLAALMRGFANMNLYKEGWHSNFLDQLARIYLLITGYKNIEALPTLLQQDLRSSIGFPQSKEELLSAEGIRDQWLAIGKQVSAEDNITTEKYWLYGINTNKYALMLQFIVRGQGAEISLVPGICIDATLVFYPSVLPLRALIKQQHSTGVVSTFSTYNNWNEVVQQETRSSAVLPTRSEQPYIIENLLPVQHNNQWWLMDTEQNMMQVKDHVSIWKYLSISGGEGLRTVVLGKEKTYEPIGAWFNNEYITV